MMMMMMMFLSPLLLLLLLLFKVKINGKSLQRRLRASAILKFSVRMKI